MNDRDKLYKLSEAIHNLEGVQIPWNIIKDYLIPLNKWLDRYLGDENTH